MLELGRILTAGGLVTASSGLVVFAMGASYYNPASFEMNLGLVLMIGGVIATIVGVALYRQMSED